MNTQIKFELLSADHFEILTAWLNKPHIQAFYSLRHWTLEEVEAKYAPCIRNEKPVKCFITYAEGKPLGFIQSYAVADYGWPGQIFSSDMLQKSAGIDLFIGDEALLNKGLGPRMLEMFLETDIWPYFDFCIVDPDGRNIASIRFFQKCGFEISQRIKSEDDLLQKVSLVLMVRSKPKNASSIFAR